MSFGGGWFFLAAAEAISVLNQQLRAARHRLATSRRRSTHGDLGKVGLGDPDDGRAWSSRSTCCSGGRWSRGRSGSSIEETEAAERPRSLVLDLLRRSQLAAARRPAPRAVGRAARTGRCACSVATAIAPVAAPTPARRRAATSSSPSSSACAIALRRSTRALRYIGGTVGFGEVAHGVRARRDHVRARDRARRRRHAGLGADRRLDRHEPARRALAQPVVQILASFPANFLFPFATLAFITAGISLNVGGILLMASARSGTSCST